MQGTLSDLRVRISHVVSVRCGTIAGLNPSRDPRKKLMHVHEPIHPLLSTHLNGRGLRTADVRGCCVCGGAPELLDQAIPGAGLAGKRDCVLRNEMERVKKKVELSNFGWRTGG